MLEIQRTTLLLCRKDCKETQEIKLYYWYLKLTTIWKMDKKPIDQSSAHANPLWHLELWLSSWEMSSTMSFSEASWAMALHSLHATKALAMASSPCCQKNRAIFCLFISTAHTISSWKGNGKWLISGSSRSMSTSSSLFLVVFCRPRRIGMSSCFREKF